MTSSQVSLDRDAEILRIIQSQQGISRKHLLLAIGTDSAQMGRADKRLASKLFRQKAKGGELKYYTIDYALEFNVPASHSEPESPEEYYAGRSGLINSLWITGRG